MRQPAKDILDTAAAGINFLDTADVYPLGGGLATAGRTEEIIDRWLTGTRDQLIVATKCVSRVGLVPWDQGASRKRKQLSVRLIYLANPKNLEHGCEIRLKIQSC